MVRPISFFPTSVRILRLMLRLLTQDPQSLRFALRWIQSLRTGHAALKDEQPALTFKALAWLEAYVKPWMSVFEYGTGGSTLFFARRVKTLVSVEHYSDWFAKLTKSLEGIRVNNCSLLLREPEVSSLRDVPTYGPGTYTSTDEQYKYVRFEAYVKSIDCYPDESFDLVLVDGRSRATCILHALPKIKPDGYLMLDNSERSQYGTAEALLSQHERTDFFGVGPYSERPWQTSIWKIRHASRS